MQTAHRPANDRSMGIVISLHDDAHKAAIMLSCHLVVQSPPALAACVALNHAQHIITTHQHSLLHNAIHEHLQFSTPVHCSADIARLRQSDKTLQEHSCTRHARETVLTRATSSSSSRRGNRPVFVSLVPPPSENCTLLNSTRVSRSSTAPSSKSTACAYFVEKSTSPHNTHIYKHTQLDTKQREARGSLQLSASLNEQQRVGSLRNIRPVVNC